MKEVLISEIIIDDRVRKNYGSLDSLERSIQQMGVLQPIGITPDKRLLFGERRLRASRNIGLKTIPARIFDIDADDPVTALRMEREENGHRLDLTPSEKVEIAKRIEEAVGKRQGQRTDLRTIASHLEPVPTLAEVPPGTKTREIAAQSVDMKPETYRKAKTVVDSGRQELIQKMDSGEKSINAAYQEVKKPSSHPPTKSQIPAPPSPAPKSITFNVTLNRNPSDDAEVLLMKGGQDYCTKLGMALLKAAGHNVEIT